MRNVDTSAIEKALAGKVGSKSEQYNTTVDTTAIENALAPKPANAMGTFWAPQNAAKSLAGLKNATENARRGAMQSALNIGQGLTNTLFGAEKIMPSVIPGISILPSDKRQQLLSSVQNKINKALSQESANHSPTDNSKESKFFHGLGSFMPYLATAAIPGVGEDVVGTSLAKLGVNAPKWVAPVVGSSLQSGTELAAISPEDKAKAFAMGAAFPVGAKVAGKAFGALSSIPGKLIPKPSHAVMTKDLLNDLATDSIANPHEHYLDEFTKAYESAKDNTANAYNKLDNAVSAIKTKFVPSEYINNAKNTIDELNDLSKSSDIYNPALQSVKSLLPDSKSVILDAKGKPIDNSGQVTLSDAIALRRKINTIMKDHLGYDPKERLVRGYLGGMKSSLDKDMDNILSTSNRPDIQQLHQDALNARMYQANNFERDIMGNTSKFHKFYNSKTNDLDFKTYPNFLNDYIKPSTGSKENSPYLRKILNTLPPEESALMGKSYLNLFDTDAKKVNALSNLSPQQRNMLFSPEDAQKVDRLIALKKSGNLSKKLTSLGLRGAIGGSIGLAGHPYLGALLATGDLLPHLIGKVPSGEGGTVSSLIAQSPQLRENYLQKLMEDKNKTPKDRKTLNALLKGLYFQQDNTP